MVFDICMFVEFLNSNITYLHSFIIIFIFNCDNYVLLKIKLNDI